MSHPHTPDTGSDPGPVPGAAPDPELLAPRVAACAGVAGLHGGRFGEVATYLPGRRVRGLRITEAGVEVHVVARYPATVAEVAAQVRAAVAVAVGPRPVHVTVADVAGPGERELDGPIEYTPLGHSSDDPTRPETTADPTSPPARAGAPPFPPPTEPRAGAATSRPPALGLDAKESSS